MPSDFLMRGRTRPAINPAEQVMRTADDGSTVVVQRYQELALRGKVFTGTVAAVTLPVNAATLASKMGLYNPPGSNVFLELIDVEIHAVVAATVVNAVGLYYSTGSNATGATFTTAGVIENGRLGEGVAPNGRFYSAVTHVGTPLLVDIIGGWGAVTDGGATFLRKEINGRILVPPSTLLAVAMTTAAGTASGVTASIRWSEIPYAAV